MHHVSPWKEAMTKKTVDPFFHSGVIPCIWNECSKHRIVYNFVIALYLNTYLTFALIGTFIDNGWKNI